jgi:TonB family protein
MAELSLAYRNSMVVVKPFSDEDEKNEGPERILTVEEFIERLRDRTDIFGADKNDRLRNTEIIMVCLAIIAGMLFTTFKTIKITPDFYQQTADMDNGSVTVKNGFIDRQPQKNIETKTAQISNRKENRTLKTGKNIKVHQEQAGGRGGIGSIISRIARTELFTLLSRNASGKDVADGEIFGKNGFAKGIDILLAGKHNGLKPGGTTSSGRKDYEGLGGPGNGYGPSGFGGTDALGIDGLINQLTGPDQLPITLRPPKTGPSVTGPRSPGKGSVLESSGDVIGGRSRSEIMRVVVQNIGALRYAYNRYLREKSGIKGKITVKFAIDEFGNVVDCEVVSSSIGYEELESAVKAKIMRWKFDKIDKPGDITEVVYPFVFST